MNSTELQRDASSHGIKKSSSSESLQFLKVFIFKGDLGPLRLKFGLGKFLALP